MVISRQEKLERFSALHVPGEPFILANAWDMGSARMLAALGAKAIGTTSSGHAFTLGRPDMGTVSRDEAMAHARDLCESVNLPVSGDLENGYGHNPADVALTINSAAEAGLVSCSIEDTALPDTSPYEFSHAVERIEAAVDSARTVEGGMLVCARADGILNRHYDVDEAIRRLKAFEKAGADILYAPLPRSMEDQKKICLAVEKPVNALCAGRYTQNTLAEFAAVGVARVSLGSSLARVTHKAMHEAAKAMLDTGDMSLLGNAIGGNVVDPLLQTGEGIWPWTQQLKGRNKQ